jgi:hypothetical protein
MDILRAFLLIEFTEWGTLTRGNPGWGIMCRRYRQSLMEVRSQILANVSKLYFITAFDNFFKYVTAAQLVSNVVSMPLLSKTLRH